MQQLPSEIRSIQLEDDLLLLLLLLLLLQVMLLLLLLLQVLLVQLCRKLAGCCQGSWKACRAAHSGSDHNNWTHCPG
jgi:hypothetical protein